MPPGLALSGTDLGPEDATVLADLVADWQLLADVCFGDLVLWAPRGERGGWCCVAQVRPLTAPTLLDHDVVGTLIGAGEAAALDRAAATGTAQRDTAAAGDRHEDVVPVRRRDRVVGVLVRTTSGALMRAPSRTERAYLQTGDDLLAMVRDGTFPAEQPLGELGGAGVGDGMARLDQRGKVTFASPNAQSAFRRLGLRADLLGAHLATVTADLARPRLDLYDGLESLVEGRQPRTLEIESAQGTAVMRVVPLVTDDRRAGAVVLVRDVTDLRRLDRQLMSKDATIREIHHRVKNNLQMVAALLRMQARRVGQPEARAALEESERRVAAIATVHELLSATPGEEADFDAALERIVAMVRQLVPDEAAVRIERRGTVGMLPAAVAMPLAMVVTELLQNAAQHAVPGGGRIAVESFRPGGALRVMISDDGPGLPDGFSASAAGLGMHIVHSLVAGELSGRLISRPAVPHGTVMVVEVPLPG